MLVVYISSPYSIGNQERNVIKSLLIADILICSEFCPIAPLLSHYQNGFFPQNYETWLKLDFEKIRRSDVILRLPGESKGADREVEFAKSLNKPVYYSLKELFTIHKED